MFLENAAVFHAHAIYPRSSCASSKDRHLVTMSLRRHTIWHWQLCHRQHRAGRDAHFWLLVRALFASVCEPVYLLPAARCAGIL